MPVQQHRKMLSGTVLWCFRCRAYVDKKTKGLKDICKCKPPRQAHRGGMEGQLRKLRNGIHPKTGAALPHPVELDPVVMPIKENGTYVVHRPPDGFYTYVPVDLPHATTVPAAGGMSSTDRRKALHDRIKAKEQANSGSVVTASIGNEADMEGCSMSWACLLRGRLDGI